MEVVADTSPLCYLILIDCIDLLPNIYEKVVIPHAVFNELSASQAPNQVQDWIMNFPNWLEIQPLETQPDVELSKLDLGEQEAITVAENLSADLIILDDKAARIMALERGFRIIGLLGILGVSAQQGLVDLSVAIERLQQTNFRISPSLVESLLEQYRDRK